MHVPPIWWLPLNLNLNLFISKIFSSIANLPISFWTKKLPSDISDILFDNLKFNKSKHFVGIRPEHLKANQENQFSFNPEIELIENLGNEKIAYMKKEEHQLSAKISSNIEIGNKIGFDLNDIFIFDENGKRLKS